MGRHSWVFQARVTRPDGLGHRADERRGVDAGAAGRGHERGRRTSRPDAIQAALRRTGSAGRYALHVILPRTNDLDTLTEHRAAATTCSPADRSRRRSARSRPGTAGRASGCRTGGSAAGSGGVARRFLRLHGRHARPRLLAGSPQRTTDRDRHDRRRLPALHPPRLRRAPSPWRTPSFALPAAAAACSTWPTTGTGCRRRASLRDFEAKWARPHQSAQLQRRLAVPRTAAVRRRRSRC